MKRTCHYILWLDSRDSRAYLIVWTSVDGYGPSADKADLYSGTHKYAMIALATSLQHGANLHGNVHGHQYRVVACYRSRQVTVYQPEARR